MGNIKSVARLKGYGFLGNKWCDEKILSQHSDKHGYMHTQLNKNSKGKNFLVHRLVAISFIPNPENKPQVNHKDKNVTNNCIENLEWSTALENCRHGKGIKFNQIDMSGNIVKQWQSLSDVKYKTIVTGKQYKFSIQLFVTFLSL